MSSRSDQNYKDGLWTIKYRRDRLEGEFDRIRKEMDGYSRIVYSYIEDDNEMIDQGKLDEMIDDMIDALDRYLEMSGLAPVSDEQKEWYRSYLYCVISCPDIDTMWLFPEYIESRTFEDIIKLADIDPKLQDMKEFIWNENHEWKYEDDTQNDILFFLKHSYCELTGKDINETYTDEQKEIYAKLKPAFALSVEEREPGSDIEELAEELDEAMGSECEEAAGSNIVLEEGYNDPAPDEDEIPIEVRAEWALEREAEEQRMFEYKLESMNRWRFHVGDEKRYEEEYLKFRKLFFTADLSRMSDDMRYLIDAYLYEKGISVYSLGDNYGLVDDAIRATSARIRQAVLRARALS